VRRKKYNLEKICCRIHPRNQISKTTNICIQ